MKRREFLLTASLSFSATFVFAKEEKENNIEWLVINQVYGVLFPKTQTMPSAKEFNALGFLQSVSKHNSFDKSDLEYILQGARDFHGSFNDFLAVDNRKKEEYIQSANSNEYGQSWLSLLIYYGIEAMLSDPVYGGNTNEIGWKSLNHNTGKPQPKYKYAKVV